MSYTTGPWKAHILPQNRRTKHFVTAGINDQIPICITDRYDIDSAEDMHLISAAPDLLEALKDLLSTVSDKEVEEHDDIGAQAHDPESCAICSARQAIARAEGKD